MVMEPARQPLLIRLPSFSKLGKYELASSQTEQTAAASQLQSWRMPSSPASVVVPCCLLVAIGCTCVIPYIYTCDYCALIVKLVRVAAGLASEMNNS